GCLMDTTVRHDELRAVACVRSGEGHPIVVGMIYCNVRWRRQRCAAQAWATKACAGLAPSVEPSTEVQIKVVGHAVRGAMQSNRRRPAWTRLPDLGPVDTSIVRLREELEPHRVRSATSVGCGRHGSGVHCKQHVGLEWRGDDAVDGNSRAGLDAPRWSDGVSCAERAAAARGAVMPVVAARVRNASRGSRN